MKLELKHLAPYLPYGLKIQGQTHGEIAEMSSVNEGNVNIKGRGFQYGWWADIFDIKPILRPLSDLTKDEFTQGWYKTCDCRTPHNINSAHLELTDLLRENLITEIPYILYQFLIENHFDVFGLIEAGLAIDMNKISS